MQFAANRGGFEQTNYALNITKDIEAQLTYTFDWSEWLEGDDTLVAVEYTVNARRNDPDPIDVISSGVTPDGLQSFVELAGGQLDKTYVVSAKITTDRGMIDRRQFRITIVERSA